MDLIFIAVSWDNSLVIDFTSKVWGHGDITLNGDTLNEQ